MSVEEDEEDEEDEDEEDFSKRVGAARLFSLRRLLPLPAMFCAPSESWRLEWGRRWWRRGSRLQKELRD